ncbi:MAG: PEP-CTERM sorting domain-containing protein [Gammaproteobacteria bacterium]|nr:PEP-CTERM sorting domain-containing protein [Gammaproteobacteria bacterium]
MDAATHATTGTPALLFAVILAAALCVPTLAAATTVRVAQESAPGAGDFDANVLGSVTAFATGLTTAGFYQYDVPNPASYNGELNGGPTPVSSLTQVFILNASDGLSLVVVHDNPNDGSGLSTQTRWNLSGDTAAGILADDPGEPVTVSMGGTQFDSTKNSAPCCTDGYAIGSLDGMWTMFGQFLTSPTGITDWAVVSSDFTNIALVLAPGRRVRLDLVSSSVPEPATSVSMLLGLAGIGWLRRRRDRRG